MSPAGLSLLAGLCAAPVGIMGLADYSPCGGGIIKVGVIRHLFLGSWEPR